MDTVAKIELLIEGMDVNNLYLVSHGDDAAGVWIPPEFAEELKNYAISLFENELVKGYRVTDPVFSAPQAHNNSDLPLP